MAFRSSVLWCISSFRLARHPVSTSWSRCYVRRSLLPGLSKGRKSKSGWFGVHRGHLDCHGLVWSQDAALWLAGHVSVVDHPAEIYDHAYRALYGHSPSFLCLDQSAQFVALWINRFNRCRRIWIIRLQLSKVVATRFSRTERKKLLLVVAASVAALFLNLGDKLVCYPFDMMFRQQTNMMRIDEWRSIDFHSARQNRNDHAAGDLCDGASGLQKNGTLLRSNRCNCTLFLPHLLVIIFRCSHLRSHHCGRRGFPAPVCNRERKAHSECHHHRDCNRHRRLAFSIRAETQKPSSGKVSPAALTFMEP